MTETNLEDMLFTLDICAESLSFELLPVHVRRLETIKAILTEHHKKLAQRSLVSARVLSLVEKMERNDAIDRSR